MADESESVQVTKEELRALVSEAVAAHDQRVQRLEEEKVRQIARAVVQEMMTGFGLDHQSPVLIQQDFARLREWRESVDQIKKRAAWTLLTTVLVGLIGILVIGVRTWLHRPH